MNNLLDELNAAQQQAVRAMVGPMMVIAGAGSGKTRVLTYKVAYLLNQGVNAYNILALTFTNKAAKEMKDRVSSLVGEDIRDLWMGTFHSIFARLLRLDGQYLGYPSNYSIYDTDDSKSTLKSIIDDLSLDPKQYPVNQIMARISAAKTNLMSVADYENNSQCLQFDETNNRSETYRIYKSYQEKLFRASAMDFDDIIFNMYLLISNFPKILEKYQHRFKYILIDEFQDTNKAQYDIIKMLSKPEENLCVVGDDAQSIYAFRGADIENILGFKKDYPKYQLFKLEQNYRSTSHIVEASNSIISKNKHQIEKKVWTDNGDGDLIRVIHAANDSEEASKVASAIFERKMNDHERNDAFAILYRTNAQSRTFEEALRKMNIPYVIYGGLSFYQRKEIKDMLAYFRLTVNHSDEEALLRIVNYPARGIGATTMEKIRNAATQSNTSTWQILSNTESLSNLKISSSTIAKIINFTEMIASFSKKMKKVSAFKLAREIATASGIIKIVKEDNTPEGIARMNNVEELLNAIGDFSEKRNAIFAIDNMGVIEEGNLITLDMFMQDVALLTDADMSNDDDDDKVQLMTIHAAKGLEFQHVFVVGLEENLFPSIKSMYSPKDIEEERRLLYVACTRAKKSLTISYAEYRFRWGQLEVSTPSRFLKDFDVSHLNLNSNANRHVGLPHVYGFNNVNDVQPSYPNPKFNSSVNDNGRSEVESQNITEVTDYNIFKPGDRVYHEKFHKGTIVNVEGAGPNRKAEVNFDDIGKKMLLLRFAKLAIVE